MKQEIAELLTFVAVFGTICVGHLVIVRKRSLQPGPKPRRRLDLVKQYSPAIDVMMEYRDARAFKTLRRIRIAQVLRNRAGRLYLLGFNELAMKPRTFRLDRIVCIASLDGEVLEMRRFLIDRLGLPADLCMNLRSPLGKLPHRSRLGAES
jgi:hypothetical protein